MTGPGFSAHPEALADLLAVPSHVRTRALTCLDRLLKEEARGPRLEEQDDRDLRGARKLYLDEQLDYRLVYTERRAPHPHERGRLLGIHLIAVGQRRGLAVYETAALRLRETTVEQVRHGGMPARFQAALAAASRPAHALAAAAATPQGAPFPPQVFASPPRSL
ncbi:hypothetical protein [Streptacidiphilus sp. MAP5-52]|uniref:hypothetical protein n=1 Tax=Streptacidiphilus sp. MAP5-52 TaxID=3156267 RepID=UPI0035125AF8